MSISILSSPVSSRFRCIGHQSLTKRYISFYLSSLLITSLFSLNLLCFYSFSRALLSGYFCRLRSHFLLEGLSVLSLLSPARRLGRERSLGRRASCVQPRALASQRPTPRALHYGLRQRADCFSVGARQPPLAAQHRSLLFTAPHLAGHNTTSLIAQK